MSVAFTREDSAQTASELHLPDRPVSPHPNLVTAEGLAALEQRLQEAQAAYNAASLVEDVDERRRQASAPLRDLRYFAERLRTAQLVPPATDNETVAFGSTVTFVRDDGRRQTYRIVGEDEADPGTGSISYVSPIGAAFIGKAAGDIVSVGDQDLEITAIS